MAIRWILLATLTAFGCGALVAAEPEGSDAAGPPRLAVEGPKPKPVDTPKPEQIDRAIDRGVRFLVERQEKNGAWGTIAGSKPYQVLADVPGAHHAFRGAVTALETSRSLDLVGKRFGCSRE